MLNDGDRLWLRACWAYLDPNRISTQPFSFRRMAVCIRELRAAGIPAPDGFAPMPEELRCGPAEQLNRAK